MREDIPEPRKIEGKKYYQYPIEYMLFIHGPFILFGVGGMFLSESENTVLSNIFLLLAALCFVGFLALIFMGRRCVCILTEDSLYFYDCDYIENEKTIRHANGYILISAITEMICITPSRAPHYVVVRGVDFEITLPSMGARLIRAAKKHGSSFRTRYLM